jgi:mannose-1-phosphate guanylyltransferase
MPKQCISIDGGPTLIQRTIRRILPAIPAERILVVTAAEMAEAIRAQLTELPPENVLVEPEGRNTAPCIGWGSVEISKRARSPDAVMVVLPADHIIDDEDEFRDLMLDCTQAARATNALVTIGIEPTRPDTGFGYLQVGGEIGHWGDRSFLRVDRFVEKPDLDTAQGYVEGGRHLWNAGMFVFSVSAIRDAFRKYLPDTWAVLENLRHSPDRLEELYGLLEHTSLDYGIMERSTNVLTVRGSFGWSDVGSWKAVADFLPASKLGRALVGASVAIDSGDCVVHAPGKVVALVGVHNLAVVDSGDALLICALDQVQRLREVIASLEEQGLHDYL